MTWLQIELRVLPGELQAIEDVLYDCGAIALTLMSDADEPVLEPAPGETPLWSSIRVQGLFDLNVDIAALRRAMSSLALDDGLLIDFVSESDWQKKARSYAASEVFGERIWLLPKDTPAATETSELLPLFLEPGLAFGSGRHPTTRLCLEWLARHIRGGQRVLDFGCGSGVLGIAAGLLGAKVIAVDHDSQAIMATRENAAYNGLTENELSVFGLEEWHAEQHIDTFDVVVANILSLPLQSLAADFERVAVTGGAIVLSGVLESQVAEVMTSYRATEFQVPTIEAGWACLAGITHTATAYTDV